MRKATTAPNEVRFKVRHYALLLEEFTVSQVVGLTGLKGSSVRTEVQRMRREGLVTASRQEAHGRGRPPCVYRLTDDPDARLALSKSVEGFYVETAPRSGKARVPASRHFFQAAELIQGLLGRRAGDPELDGAVEEAAYHLEFAWREEGVGREGTEVVGAFLKREMAKVEALRGNLPEAEQLFRQSIVAFQGTGLQDEVDRVQRDWLCVMLRRLIAVGRADRNLDWPDTLDMFQHSLGRACEGELQKCSLARLLRDLLELTVERVQTRRVKSLVLDDARAMIEQTAREVAQHAAREMSAILESERTRAMREAQRQAQALALPAHQLERLPSMPGTETDLQAERRWAEWSARAGRRGRTTDA